MPINLVQESSVDNVLAQVKFEPSLRVSTITNDRFTLYTDEATPVLVSSDPFETIDLVYDYNSISRILKLSWKSGVLSADVDYMLVLSGFKNAYNQLIDDDYIYFTIEGSATPDYADPTIPDEIEIVDYSLVPDLPFADVSTGDDDEDEGATPNLDFEVVETDPIQYDAFLPEDYNNGVVTIEFSGMINPAFATSEYFIAERKIIQRRPARWESVDAQAQVSSNPYIVRVLFPSTDDPAQYNTPDLVYFEENYRYRVRILKGVGV